MSAFFVGGAAVAGSPPSFALDTTPLANSRDGRELLRYVVGCALPRQAEATLEVDGQSFTFPGSMGLAPDWQTRGLSEAEQELVTACILSRTNAFGVTVEISLRGSRQESPPTLSASAEEELAFPYFEAAFFGNIFLDEPRAYVSPGRRRPGRRVFLERAKRVCSLANGTGRSRCGFDIADNHESDGSFVMDGHRYAHAIRVFLRDDLLKMNQSQETTP